MTRIIDCFILLTSSQKKSYVYNHLIFLNRIAMIQCITQFKRKYDLKRTEDDSINIGVSKDKRYTR